MRNRIHSVTTEIVSIEDDVIIQENGCEILNKTTKDLVVLN